MCFTVLIVYRRFGGLRTSRHSLLCRRPKCEVKTSCFLIRLSTYFPYNLKSQKYFTFVLYKRCKWEIFEMPEVFLVFWYPCTKIKLIISAIGQVLKKLYF